MHLLFIDESGNLAPCGKPSSKYFVLGGVIIPEEIWPKLSADLKRLKREYAVTGEIKWRYFIAGNAKTENSLLHLDAQKRDKFRLDLFHALARYKSIKIISVICDIQRAYLEPSIRDDAAIYHRSYKMLTERFQYLLQDLERESGQHINGLIICDHRNRREDERLRQLHERLVNNTGIFTSSYKNIIEGLFLAPSHYSVGIQFADLVAGAVFRKYEASDERFYEIIKTLVRTSPLGSVEGYGLVRLPRGGG